MKKAYFMSNLVTPTDVWGADYFKKTWGDFFPNVEVLGGMWDYLLYDKDGKPSTVLEMKTSKRVEDWAEDIPEYTIEQVPNLSNLREVVASVLEGGE